MFAVQASSCVCVCESGYLEATPRKFHRPYNLHRDYSSTARFPSGFWQTMALSELIMTETSFPSCLWAPPSRATTLYSVCDCHPVPALSIRRSISPWSSQGSRSHTIWDWNPLVVVLPSHDRHAQYTQLDTAHHSMLSPWMWQKRKEEAWTGR